MIQFNELRVTPDGKRLIVDVKVPDIEYYENVYIDTIQIDNQSTFIENGPSSKPLYVYTVGDDTEAYHTVEIQDEGVKRVRLELCQEDFMTVTVQNDVASKSYSANVASDLFFVYVSVRGTVSADTPCGYDNITTLGVAYNTYPIYCMFMGSIRQAANECEISKDFEDAVLRYNAFTYALQTGNNILGISYYNKFFKNRNCPTVNIPKCNCNG